MELRKNLEKNLGNLEYMKAFLSKIKEVYPNINFLNNKVYQAWEGYSEVNSTEPQTFEQFSFYSFKESIERFASRFLYVKQMSKFVEIKTGHLFGKTDFDMIGLGEILPFTASPRKKGVEFTKISITSFFRDYGYFFRRVDKSDIFVGNKDIIVQKGSESYFNEWSLFEKDTPKIKEARVITGKDKQAVSIFFWHCSVLFNEQFRTEKIKTNLFLEYLSNIIQNPAKRKPYFYVISSIHGLGKSFLIEILKNCINRNLVVELTSDDLKGEFNSIFVGKLMVILEEFDTRFFKKVKTWITSPNITYRRKYEHNAVKNNISHFLAFTNIETLEGVEKTERRILFTRSSIWQLKELERQVLERWSLTLDQYFSVLRDLAKPDNDLILRFLNEIKISKNFDANHWAIKTEEGVLAEEKTNLMINGYEESLERIDTDQEYLFMPVLAFNLKEHHKIQLNTYQRSELAKALGFRYWKKIQALDKKIVGVYKRVGVKGCNDQARLHVARVKGQM